VTPLPPLYLQNTLDSHLRTSVLVSTSLIDVIHETPYKPKPGVENLDCDTGEVLTGKAVVAL
jgi:hypothetical protein